MKNTILLVLLVIIGVLNVFKVFTLDNHLKDSKEYLKSAQSELQSAKEANFKAKNEIEELKKAIEKYKFKNQQIQLQIDSIAVAKKAKAPKDWAERQDIRRKQKEIKKRLEYLRQKEKEFE